MRLFTCTLCLVALVALVALVGCSDTAVPTEHTQPTLDGRRTPGQANDAGPSSPLIRTGAEVAPVLTRMEWLIGDRVSKVAIPPDDYSGSPDAVHPDIACPGDVWNGRRCWLMYTPYHNGDSHFENPGVLYEADDTSWSTPPSVRNPLIPYPGAAQYNSDPDQAFDAVTRRMVQVYRLVADSSNYIYMMSTADEAHWTRPVMIFREPLHDAVSPSLVLERDRTAKLWYVQSGRPGCDAASSTVVMRTAMPAADSSYEHAAWSKPVPVTMSIPKYVVWHLDVMAMSANRGYLALIAAFPAGVNCANSDLWIAWSADGLRWTTYAVPILWRTMQAAKNRKLATWYRGTMHEDSATGRLHLWPSALTDDGWAVFHTSVNLAAMLDLLRSAQPADFKPALLARTNRMPLANMP